MIIGIAVANQAFSFPVAAGGWRRIDSKSKRGIAILYLTHIAIRCHPTLVMQYSSVAVVSISRKPAGGRTIVVHCFRRT